MPQIKLTPAQADVIRKMREGAEFSESHVYRVFWCGSDTVSGATFDCLIKKGLIERATIFSKNFKLTPLADTITI